MIAVVVVTAIVLLVIGGAFISGYEYMDKGGWL